MARFIPDVPVESIQHDSERLVYEALRGLPSGFTVLHSFPWFRPNRDFVSEPLREGEADFVILSPKYGLLVLEVKGGVPTLINRTWYRGGKEMRDPFDQASRNKYALLDALKERTKGEITKENIRHGIAVIFPHTNYEGQLPLNTDRRILISAENLKLLPEKIVEAFCAWPSRGEIEPDRFKEILDALLPKLRLVRYEKTEIDSDVAKIVQITQTQQQILLGLLTNNRVLVRGVAGSGKTMLALEFSRELASQGKRVLLLCFNRNLAEFLRTSAEGSSYPVEGTEGKIEVHTFHSLALNLANKAGVEFTVPEDNAQQFWDEEASLILEQSLSVLSSRGKAVEFDSVVVDEGQDFSPEWWITIDSLFGNQKERNLYVFLDLKQSWRTAPSEPPIIFDTSFSLDTNCRNTKCIATPAAKLVSINSRTLDSSPVGEQPIIRRCTMKNMAGMVKTEIIRLANSGVTPSQIAIIGPFGLQKGSLKRFNEISGMPLISDTRKWKAGEGLLVTTARAFKGLEADVVIIYDLNVFGELFGITDLYIAWTRARTRLIVMPSSDEARALIEGLFSTKN